MGYGQSLNDRYGWSGVNHLIHVALFLITNDWQVAARQLNALLGACTLRGWHATTICHTIPDITGVLAAGDIHTVVAIAATRPLAEAVTAAGGVLEVVRDGPGRTDTAPPGLAIALGAMVRAGRLTPDEAAELLHAARPPHPDDRPDRADLQRRPRRPA
jgi:hypothetical protein